MSIAITQFVYRLYSPTLNLCPYDKGMTRGQIPVTSSGVNQSTCPRDSDAEKIIMVCDNLNTHDKSSFYEAFPPAEALRLAKRFEFHYTPKHGSWLDIAEIELSALSKQCLGKRRIDNMDDLNAELEKWHTDRNKRQKGVDWQFTNEEARVKLKHLYPLVNF